MKTRLSAYVAAALLLLTGSHASALFYDSFAYAFDSVTPANNYLGPTDGTAGKLNVDYGVNWYYVGVSPAAPPSVASSSLDFNNVPGYSGLPTATGNSASASSAATAGVRIQVTSPAAPVPSTVYWSALLQVNSISVTAANGALVGGLVSGIGTGAAPGVLGAVLKIRRDAVDTTKFNIGIAKDNANQTGENQWSGALDLGVPYFIVEALHINSGTGNDTVDGWINPIVALSEPSAQVTSTGTGTDASTSGIQSFNLRNVATVGAYDAQFDELRYGMSWADVMPIPEPSISVIGVVGLLVILRRIRLGRR